MQWLLVALAGVMSSIVMMAQPWPMQVLVDHVLNSHPMPAWLARLTHVLPSASTRGGLIAWIAVATLIFYTLGNLFDAIVSYAWVRVGQRMVYDLAGDLFATTQRQSLRFHAQHPVGDSMSRVMTDSWCVNNVVESLLFTPAIALITSVGMIAVMWKMNRPLAIAALVVAPLVAIGSIVAGKKLRTIAKARREIESGMQAHVQQVLSGIHVVQAFGQESREHERFTSFAGEAIGAFRRSVLVTNLSNLYTGLVLTLGTGAVLLLGARQVIAGHLLAGKLLIFLAYVNALQAQITTLVKTYSSLQSRRAEIDRVSEYLDWPREIADAPDAVAHTIRGDVSFENVTFGYESHRPVLKDIQLDLRAGETIALVGPSGAGKTTLASMVARFNDPWQGVVRIDGVDARRIRVKDLREQVAIVLQEPFLFPVSIAENIAFGKPGASREQIERAAETANATEFIRDLPEGFDTIIGERGATLSGGQKQRLSIARALLKDAPILILDEPTAALDTLTERSILEAMRRLMEGRTTLIIAHRLSTIRNADRIAVLEHGRIVELGKHDELIQRGGLYAKFCNVQTAPVTL
jgi:ATP-binding cassette subfamily B protein/subfamily B ATP-binding cassette protein MsbA